MASSSPSLCPTFKLNDGREMPAVGLGTFQGSYDYKSVHDQVVKSVRSAVDVGYRAFDTAAIYDTERPLGQAISEKIQEGAVKRKDLFIATKLWCTSHRRSHVTSALQKSLGIMGLDYVDMYLIHWPMAMQPSDEINPEDADGNILFEDDLTPFTDTWQGMEECVKQGLARSIGVSNFNKQQMQRLLKHCTIRPAYIQIESNPFFPNSELVKFCQDEGILVACYSPLGKPSRTWDNKEGDPFISTDPTICEIAKKHNRSPAQVCLRFQYQRGCAVVPKSNNPGRQRENINIVDFNLSDEEMDAIYTCDRNFRVLWLHKLRGSKEYPFVSKD